MNRKIKNILALALIVAGTCGWAAGEAAQTSQAAKTETPERAVVPLSNPAKPAKIDVTIMRGSITIRGYQGKEVIVEARTREKALNMYYTPGAYSTGYAGAPPAPPAPATRVAPPAKVAPTPAPAPAAPPGKSSEDMAKALEKAQEKMAKTLAEQAELVDKIQWEAQSGVLADLLQDRQKAREEKEKKIAGMKRLSGDSSGLEVEEENNVITITTQSFRTATDLDIQVPVASSLDIQSSMDGAVVVEGVSGEIDINNINGPVTLRNVSGTVLVHTVNGDIEAVLTRLAPEKPLSFSTMNGDIDVTLPSDARASLKMKTEQGDIYSDFDINMTRQPVQSEPAAKTEQGKYRITFDKSLYGTINGGGQEISFTSFRGDIFIRKRK